jgi:hypothetical protein
MVDDNSATHAYPQGSTAKMWGTGFRFRGFEMSHTRVLFLPPKTTSEIQRLDGGIIQSFKCQWRKFLLRWLLRMLEDMDGAIDMEKMKPDVKQAIMWTRDA